MRVLLPLRGIVSEVATTPGKKNPSATVHSTIFEDNQSTIAIAKSLGLKTLNFARSEAALDLARQAGGDLCLPDTKAGQEEALNTIAEPERPALALNAVGGDSALRLINVLGPGGTLVT